MVPFQSRAPWGLAKPKASFRRTERNTRGLEGRRRGGPGFGTVSVLATPPRPGVGAWPTWGHVSQPDFFNCGGICKAPGQGPDTRETPHPPVTSKQFERITLTDCHFVSDQKQGDETKHRHSRMGAPEVVVFEVRTNSLRRDTTSFTEPPGSQMGLPAFPSWRPAPPRIPSLKSLAEGTLF